MHKLTTKSALFAALISAWTAPAAMFAGENGHPVLNSAGRFFGVGYSHQGYQTSAGPMNIIRQRHPAEEYASSHLLAPYYVTRNARIEKAQARPLAMGRDNPTDGIPREEVVVPISPPKPVGPPPNWLEPYLEEQAPTAPPNSDAGRHEPAAASGSLFGFPAGEPSPSDRSDARSLGTPSSALRVPATQTFMPPLANRYRRNN